MTKIIPKSKTPWVYLKKGEEKRIRSGHPWIFSNEIDMVKSPLKTYAAGDEVIVSTYNNQAMGLAYINPHSLIAARLLSKNLDESLSEAFFTKRLESAYLIRHHLFKRPFYRLVFSEGDELPGLIIDRFGQDFVMQINTAGMEQKTQIIVSALCRIFPDIRSILLRNDSMIREQEGLTLGIKPAYGQPPEVIQLEENGLQFNAPLLKGQKTGWFYDHRFNRARLKDYVAGMRVLDVFSYLGAFGIHAAFYGAASVDCLDSSAFACEFIKKNAVLNHLNDKVEVICADAFDGMKELLMQGKKYDVIILDPPAFVKKRKDQKAGFIAYQRINELALKLLSDHGILVSCSCSMHVSMDDLVQIIHRAAHRSAVMIQMLERGHQGPDHPIHLAIPETDYLKTIIVRKMKI